MNCSQDGRIPRSCIPELGAGTVHDGAVRMDGSGPAKRNAGSGVLAEWGLPIVLLLCFSSCSKAQVIQESQLDDGRIQETIERASDASGLPVNHPLSVKLVDRNELREILRQNAVEAKQWEMSKAKQDGYNAMGFVPAEEQDVYEHTALLSRSVSGLYVPRTQTLYVVREHARSQAGGVYLNSLGDLDHETVLAHEIIHALQHLHYPDIFESKEAVWHYQADAAMALQAAIEGDANLWSAQSLGFWGRPRDPDDVIRLSKAGGVDPLSDAHALVRERLVFPYTYGYRFAHHEGRNGLKQPPASTEQVIHIGTKGRSAFSAINLSNFAGSLSTRGCRLSFQDTMGELMLSLWLRSFNSMIDQQVWEGWDGDRWIAVTCGNSREVAWLTSWDTERDAVEFQRALTSIVTTWQQRADLRSALTIERIGREVVVVSDGIGADVGQVQALADRARVTTRAELSAHFAQKRK